MVSTSVSGMPASFSPKCSCVGTLRLVVGEADDGAAVIADRGRQARQFGRRGIGDAAAEAEADDADRPDTLDRIDRGLGVAQHRRPVGIGDEFARVGDFVRRIAALEIRLDAVEDRRRDRDIACARETVADRADVVIDAKDLLDHHDGRLGRACGIGAIAAQFETVRSRQLISCPTGHPFLFEVALDLVRGTKAAGLLPHPVVAPVALPAGQPALAELQIEPVACWETIRCRRYCGRRGRSRRPDGR